MILNHYTQFCGGIELSSVQAFAIGVETCVSTSFLPSESQIMYSEIKLLSNLYFVTV